MIQANKLYIGSTEIQKAYIGSTIVWEASSSYTEDYFTVEFLESGSSTINSGCDINVNNTGWETITGGTVLSVSSGDTVQIRGNNVGSGLLSGSTLSPRYNVYGNIMSLIYGDNFIGQETLPVDNRLSHLFKGTSVVDASNLVLPAQLQNNQENAYCYWGMFQGCTLLTAAPQLPSTAVDYYSYYEMFAGCTSLTVAPALPATALNSGCYYDMFSGCTSLTSAPELPATSLEPWCYFGMFKGCTSLTTAPDLPAQSLRDYCYKWMFSGCTNLNYIKCLATNLNGVETRTRWVDGVAETGTFVKAASAVWPSSSSLQPASNIPDGWTVKSKEEEDYLTFDIISGGTIGLFTVNGDTPKTIQYSLNGGEWTSMVADGQTLSVSAGDTIRMKGNNPCYSNGTSDGTYNTFNGSSASFNVKGNIMSLIYGDNFTTASTLESGYTFPNLFRYTNVVDASGMVLPAAAITTFCYVSMFRNCTSLTKAPSILPAPTLAVRCYSYMFQGCTSLTSAPELPATTLVDNSYRQMFDGCTSLNYIKCLATDNSAYYCTYLWAQGVAASGTFVKAASMSEWTTGTGGIPSGWTVQDA